MSRTFQMKKIKFCQMITKVWENDFQAFLVNLIFENFGGSRSATVLPDTLKPILMYSYHLHDTPI